MDEGNDGKPDGPSGEMRRINNDPSRNLVVWVDLNANESE